MASLESTTPMDIGNGDVPSEGADDNPKKLAAQPSLGSLNNGLDGAHIEDDISTWIDLVAKYGKERLEFAVSPDTTIAAIKTMLQERTCILAHRQKLIGLTALSGKVHDDLPISQIRIKKKPLSFILMGTPEEQIFVDPSDKDDLPNVVDDFDLDWNAGSAEWVRQVATGETLRKFTAKTAVHVMNEPRPGKPLLVLDLDHTLLDFSSKTLQRTAIPADSMKRPHMDPFLAACYRHYDLVVWSQTSWRWLETKLTELNMVSHPAYKFCFVLDKTSMFTIQSPTKSGELREHFVKPLQIIWSKFNRWGPHNTVHVDDLTRNFALNWGNGLRVSAYFRKKSRQDSELVALKKYLEELAVSGLPFDQVNFEEWSEVAQGRKQLSRKDS